MTVSEASTSGQNVINSPTHMDTHLLVLLFLSPEAARLAICVNKFIRSLCDRL